MIMAVQQIIPSVVQRIYRQNMSIPPGFFEYLADLFYKTRVEALPVFSEFFVESKKGKHNLGNFMATFPIKSTTRKILGFFRNLAERITSEPFRLFETGFAPPKSSGPFAYEIGYLMAIVIAIDYLFRNNVDVLIVPKGKFLEIGMKKFSFSYQYLSGVRYGTKKPAQIKPGSLDDQLFEARLSQDSAKIREILKKAGVPIVTKGNFKKFYNADANFYIYRFEKKHVLAIRNIIKLSQANFYKYYSRACTRLGISCVFDERRMAQIFFGAVEEYNKWIKKKDYKLP
jgi:hypothetical protein